MWPLWLQGQEVLSCCAPSTRKTEILSEQQHDLGDKQDENPGRIEIPAALVDLCLCTIKAEAVNV